MSAPKTKQQSEKTRSQERKALDGAAGAVQAIKDPAATLLHHPTLPLFLSPLLALPTRARSASGRNWSSPRRFCTLNRRKSGQENAPRRVNRVGSMLSRILEKKLAC